MRRCCVCGKRNVEGGLFFTIPKVERRKNTWSKICQRNFGQKDFICGDHFLPSDIPKRYMLMPSAMPFFKAMEKQVPFQESIMINCETQTDMIDLDPDIINCETETDPIAFYKDVQTEISRQKELIRNLNTQIKELQIQLHQANKVVSCMTSLFTDGQIRKIISPGAVQWKWNDISSAICLHAAGPRAYNHLYRKGFPLPSISTLQRWSRKINISEGILTPAIDFMRHNTELSKEEKLCVLVFDEMKVVETFEYAAVGDFVRKPVNYVQVAMA